MSLCQETKQKQKKCCFQINVCQSTLKRWIPTHILAILYQASLEFSFHEICIFRPPYCTGLPDKPLMDSTLVPLDSLRTSLWSHVWLADYVWWTRYNFNSRNISNIPSERKVTEKWRPAFWILTLAKFCLFMEIRRLALEWNYKLGSGKSLFVHGAIWNSD